MEERRSETHEADGNTLGSALSDLAGEVGTLVRQEVEIARCELAQAASEAKSGATKIGAGMVFGLSALVPLNAAAVLGLTILFIRQFQWEPLTAASVAALAVAVILGIVAFALLKSGSREIQPGHFVPRRTMETLKEDVRWAREQI